MKVEIFIPCYIDQFFPEIAFHTIEILKKANCEVHYNPEQSCCGKPAFLAGKTKTGRNVAEKFLNDFSEKGYIVTPSGSCTDFVKTFYSEMFENASLHNAYKNVNRNIFELSDFLVNVAGVTSFDAGLNAIAIVHEHCSFSKLKKESGHIRTLLKNVNGLVISEFNDDMCCGLGNQFSSEFPEMAETMAKRKLETALDKNAEIIISSDMTCLLHFRKIIEKENYPLQALHISEVLTSKN
ncbi:MAG: (Fe-S)-binding protein [Chitinophagaceae bacterium]|nr:MAG: (Fe-S)-binding protein [Chitinophagaceae bacterium]